MEETFFNLKSPNVHIRYCPGLLGSLEYILGTLYTFLRLDYHSIHSLSYIPAHIMYDHERQKKVHVIHNVSGNHLGKSALILISAGLCSDSLHDEKSSK